MSVTLESTSLTGPVHSKEQVQMMRLGIQNLVGENIDEVAQGFLHTFHNVVRHYAGFTFHEAAVQVGVGLDDV